MGRFEGEPFNIFKTMANHSELMKRWMVFANHILVKSTLPVREREIDHPAHRLSVSIRLRVGPARADRAPFEDHRRRDPPHQGGARREGLERSGSPAVEGDRRIAFRRARQRRDVEGPRRSTSTRSS